MEYNKYIISFRGNGLDYFKIQLVNILLTMVTLGLYYPWAKARSLNYLYGQTVFEGQPFVFSGTGAEMFKGFIKAFALLVLFYASLVVCILNRAEVTGVLLLYGCLLLVMPLSIHGSYRYRFAKTTWSGIRFGYTGDKWAFVRLFIKGVFLSILTLGIYSPWFLMNMRRYLICNIRIGDARFAYKGVGSEYFLLTIKGYFLTVFTLGIYYFWWQKELFAYYVENMRLTRNEETMLFRTNATGGDFAGLIIVNLLLFIFTLGLATPWIVVRTLDFVMQHIVMDGTIEFDLLRQEQTDYSDATGEDMSDFFDFGFVI
ncbi:MAG: DUF898 domain-containing protein [Sediminibacterium sp.]|nr:DUF898 domain-containing protein [Sediminibacterium sp.]